MPTQIARQPRNNSVFWANRALSATITAEPARLPSRRAAPSERDPPSRLPRTRGCIAPKRVTPPTAAGMATNSQTPSGIKTDEARADQTAMGAKTRRVYLLLPLLLLVQQGLGVE